MPSAMEAEPQSPRAAGFACLPHDVAAAVFARLSPRTLAVAACASRAWRRLAAEQPWHEHYAALWGEPDDAAAAEAADAQRRYGARKQLARCWLGRPMLDKLGGHSSAVKACCLLPQRGLLFSGGVDRVVRCWDLQAGIQLGASRRHGGTVRCLAVDAELLASGSSDHAIRVWQRAPGSSGGGGSSGGSACLPFDLVGERRVLRGHTGPVSALALTPDLLLSASWDRSIRCWARGSLECVAAVHTADWVYALALGGGLLAAACRNEVLLFSLEGGRLQRLGSLQCPIRRDSPAHGPPAAITALACTPDGRAIAVGTQCGSVWLAEVCQERGACTSSSCGSGGSGSMRGLQHVLQAAAEVSSLAWDYPWLAVADHSGAVALHDLGSATPAGAASIEGGKPGPGAGAVATSGAGAGNRRSKSSRARSEAASRQLYSASIGGAASGAQCVALAGSWAAAGLDCGTLVTWDGSRGLHQMAAAAAAKQHKAAKRQQRQAAQQQQQRGPRRGGAPGGGGGGGGSQPVGIPPRIRPPVQAPVQAPEPEGQAWGDQMEAPAAFPALGQSPSGRSLLGRSPGGRARVPPPLHPEALAAASCRQQAWQVLGSVARGGGGDGGGGAGPSGPATGVRPAASP